MNRQVPETTNIAVSHPALRAILTRWTVHRGSAPIPSQDDLPFINLGPWQGNLRRVEIASDDTLRLLPCRHARVEPSAEILARDCRQAAKARAPVRARLRPPGAASAWHETLILPFAGRDERVSLLLVVSYKSEESAEDSDQRRHQKREQRRAHEELAGRALEKA